MSKKSTLEDVIRVADKLGFEVLDKEYIDSSTKMNFKCKKCGTIKCISFKNLSQYTNRKTNPCIKCKINPRKLTFEQIKKYIEIDSNSNCKLLETKESYKEKTWVQPKMALCKIDIQCSCGDKYSISFNTFKSNKQFICPKCSYKISGKKSRYSYEEVKNYIEVESNSGCKLLSKEYKDYHSKLHIKCSCGNDFYRAFCEFKGTKNRKGVHKCKKCTGATIKYTTEQITKELGKHDIKLLSEYKNYSEELLVEYNCGFTTNRSLANIIVSEYKCPHCTRKGYGRDTERLMQEIYDITNGEYELLSEYKTMNDKVTILHKECGNKYEVTPHHFLDGGNRCPKCSISKGEKYIDDYFKLNKINNIPQYEYKDLVGLGGLPLKFDFAIFDNDNNLIFLLEYDGEFHYFPINGQLALKKQQEHDRRKDEYCKLHNIDLLRIPYWESDIIEEILNEKLIKELI